MHAGRSDPATVADCPSSSSPASPRIVAASRRAHGPLAAAVEVEVGVGLDDCSLVDDEDEDDGSAGSAASSDDCPVPAQPAETAMRTLTAPRRSFMERPYVRGSACARRVDALVASLR